MQSISLTLVPDGTSDRRMLMPLIEALMDQYCPVPFETRFVDWLPQGTRTTAERVKAAVGLYPCDILFVHRDAESAEPAVREAEIRVGMAGAQFAPSLICVIPIRMTEAWLLTSETAIRAAVGNPHGVSPLNLPPLARLESIDAKEVLLRALELAKDLGARRSRKFKPEAYRHRVAELLEEFDQLRQLPSFQHLESQVRAHFQPDI